MDRTRPYHVNGEKVHLVVMNATDGLPAAFALMGTRARKKVALRFLGGCKGMGPDDKRAMLSFFSKALRGFEGLAWSGGTRQVANGEVDPMVTDVPGLIASENPGCVALGTCPRTSMLSLQEDSRLVLDEYGTVPNPDMLGILIVQNGPDGKAEWDLDVPTYFTMMEHWRTYAGFEALGTIAWNGGPITKDEIMHSARRGWPTVLVEGTGRAADEVIAQIESGHADVAKFIPQFHVISKNDPVSLRNLLVASAFIEG